MAEKAFVLLCDSVADLPESFYSDDSIIMIPHGLVVDGVEYWDDFGKSMPPKEICRRMRAGESFSTLQGRLEDFLREFTAAAQSGRDALYVAFSTGLSGTYGTSVMAANMVMEKYPDRKMICVDTRAASMGLGIQAIEALRLREQGLGIEAVAAEVEKRRLHACHFFTVDDLNHLQRGGRLSKSSALIGTLIGIKPVLYVSDEGKLTPLSKVRGRKASIQEMVKLAVERIVGEPAGQIIYISHADAHDDANELAHMLSDALPGIKTEICELNPVISVHSGPGTIAMLHWGSQRL